MRPPKSPPPLPPARIWVLLASEASTAVIFRRGPSRWTRLYLWNTRTDEITPGSWFEGQLYEAMSDLSPDGEHLLYFARNESLGRQRAAKVRFGVDRFDTWTALCRPPWVKAVGLWRVSGGFTGGGVFDKNRTVWLYNIYSSAETPIQPGGFTVRLGKAESQPPILLASMQRSGWQGIQPSASSSVGDSLPLTLHKGALELRLSKFEYKVHKTYLWHKPQPAPGLEGASWADIDQQGRLVYARAGKLLAVTAGHEVELADLNPDQPLKRAGQNAQETSR
ncbi:hypothetical protein [Deinococcus alpinitundrae]|uniref:hypothetical protein n=1 Tax=Deinococcus alpinitundrae TaxID=468913 RepID=UPI00137A8942|nr:hypothetical protein [Deinococcus alpinitundrae]